jgi:hypothetical protein
VENAIVALLRVRTLHYSLCIQGEEKTSRLVSIKLDLWPHKRPGRLFPLLVSLLLLPGPLSAVTATSGTYRNASSLIRRSIQSLTQRTRRLERTTQAQPVLLGLTYIKYGT